MKPLVLIIVFISMIFCQDFKSEFYQEQEIKMLTFLKENFPERYQILISMKSKQPRKYYKEAPKFIKKFSVLDYMKTNNPELYLSEIERLELEEKILKLKKEYLLESGKNKKDTIISEMRTLLEQEFEMKSKIAEEEILKIEIKLKENKEKLKLRQSNKSKVIETKINEILENK